jgi:hypothetical protein
VVNTGPDDLSFAYADLGTGPTGCNGLVHCILETGCSTQACISNCRKNAGTAARTLYDDSLRCGQNWCLGAVDGGVSACVVQSGMLVDAVTGSGACDQCLFNSLAALFGTACDPTGDPNCNPPQCLALYQQCGANLP